MKSIKSHNHIMKSCEITKCSLSCFDNKRYILKDGITTLAYGHLVAERQATWLTLLVSQKTLKDKDGGLKWVGENLVD